MLSTHPTSKHEVLYLAMHRLDQYVSSRICDLAHRIIDRNTPDTWLEYTSMAQQVLHFHGLMQQEEEAVALEVDRMTTAVDREGFWRRVRRDLHYQLADYIDIHSMHHERYRRNFISAYQHMLDGAGVVLRDFDRANYIEPDTLERARMGRPGIHYQFTDME